MKTSGVKDFAVDAVEDAAAHFKHGIEEGGERMAHAMHEAAASLDKASGVLSKVLRHTVMDASKEANAQTRAHPLLVGILMLSLVSLSTLLLIPHRR
ncbi:hypothetical protein ASG43_05060 [Aureimonas sp. Leaf454]|uniref:hypothetical protein n=1 Tax=Aureimonas sp. Leaf454 TaxID=1736381 RepID=UPI0006F517A2|nr:hypothetical protein [Aureimonas sp. Leaf454]KQT50660.1 hypothetical protein ASG43_05060 [Aureimonas sp. Leaf454]